MKTQIVVEDIKIDDFYDSTDRQLIDFLNASRDRKIQILKSLVNNFNGLSQGQIDKIINKTTSFARKSIDRKLAEQSQCRMQLNRPKHSNFLIR